MDEAKAVFGRFLKNEVKKLCDQCSCLGGSNLEEVLNGMRSSLILLTVDASQDSEITAAYCNELAKSLTAILGCLSELGDTNKRNNCSEPPPTLLSLNAFKAVYSAVEIVWVLSLQSQIEAFLKCEIKEDTHPKSLLISAASLASIRDRVSNIVPVSSSHFLDHVMIILNIVTSTTFAGMMVDRNFRRALLGLMVASEDPEVGAVARGALQQLLDNDKYKYLAVFHLKSVVSMCCPEFRLKLTGMFNSILLGEGGLELVLRGFLFGVEESHLQRLQLQLVKIITSVPSGMESDYYFNCIVPQVLWVLRSSVRAGEKVLVSQCALVVARLSVVQRPTATRLIATIAAPISTALSDSRCSPSANKALDSPSVDESVAVLFALVSACPLSPALTQCIHEARGDAAILRLLVEHSDSQMEEAAFQFMVVYLQAIDASVGAGLFKALIEESPGSPALDSTCGLEPESMYMHANSSTNLLRVLSKLLGSANLNECRNRIDLVISRLFLGTLREYLGLTSAPITFRAACFLMGALEDLPIESLLCEGTQILLLIQSFLEAFASRYESAEYAALTEDKETLECALSILSSVVRLGSTKRSEAEEDALGKIMTPLLVVGKKEPSAEISQAAADIGIMLMSRATEAIGDNTPKQTFSEIIESSKIYLQSIDPSLRSMGVRCIITYLRDESNFLTTDEKLTAVAIFVETLDDTESFVYLSAIHAISNLALLDRVVILSHVVSLLTASEQLIKSRNKALLVEAIILIIRKAGPSTAPYASMLVHAAVRLARLRPTASAEEGLQSAQIDLKTLRAKKPNEEGFEIADAILFRQSSVALLAELAAVCGWSFFSHLWEIVDIAKGIFVFERGDAQYTVASRRSASYLLRHIILGLKEKLLQSQLGAGHLKDVYRSLKVAAVDTDNIVKFHAESALGDLDEYMRSQLFPSQS